MGSYTFALITPGVRATTATVILGVLFLLGGLFVLLLSGPSSRLLAAFFFRHCIWFRRVRFFYPRGSRWQFFCALIGC